MLIRPMMLGLPRAGAGGGLRFTDADPSWTISEGGLRAAGGSPSAITLARTNIARTTGPGAFSMLVNAVPDGNSAGLGLYPPDAALQGAPATGRVIWRPTGGVAIAGTVQSTAAPTYGPGDTLTFRLDAAGSTLTLIKNGVVGPSYSIPVLSRVPAVSSNTSGQDITINGTPTGETPW